ncbi:hypothetical protein ACFVT2_21845 [Streptomyces sp. NPDC058000]|uniref:hypothetical protein n=1 Tax=Streptomyces sp. NPDC058000 TaxID=3346299 RepID=UPI0036E40BD9
MGKALRVVAGTLGAGALLLSVAGTASAKGGGDRFIEDVRCAPSFSLSLLFPPTDGCRTDVGISANKRITKVVQSAGGSIYGIDVDGGRGRR